MFHFTLSHTWKAHDMHEVKMSFCCVIYEISCYKVFVKLLKFEWILHVLNQTTECTSSRFVLLFCIIYCIRKSLFIDLIYPILSLWSSDFRRNKVRGDVTIMNTVYIKDIYIYIYIKAYQWWKKAWQTHKNLVIVFICINSSIHWQVIGVTQKLSRWISS